MATKKQAPGADPVPTITYTVLTPVHHDGEDYLPGLPIWLTAEQAKPLLDVQAIGPQA